MSFEQLMQFLPSDGLKVVLVLFLSFLIGLIREERKANDPAVRTFLRILEAPL